jgi:hypothetical protein
VYVPDLGEFRDTFKDLYKAKEKYERARKATSEVAGYIEELRQQARAEEEKIVESVQAEYEAALDAGKDFDFKEPDTRTLEAIQKKIERARRKYDAARRAQDRMESNLEFTQNQHKQEYAEYLAGIWPGRALDTIEELERVAEQFLGLAKSYDLLIHFTGDLAARPNQGLGLRRMVGVYETRDQLHKTAQGMRALAEEIEAAEENVKAGVHVGLLVEGESENGDASSESEDGELVPGVTAAGTVYWTEK